MGASPRMHGPRRVLELAARLRPAAIVAAGSERGNDVMARVAARADLPLAANCVEAAPGADGVRVTRMRWGGSLLEEAALHGSPALVTVAPHAVAARRPLRARRSVERFTPALAEADLRVRARRADRGRRRRDLADRRARRRLRRARRRLGRGLRADRGARRRCSAPRSAARAR